MVMGEEWRVEKMWISGTGRDGMGWDMYLSCEEREGKEKGGGGE